MRKETRAYLDEARTPSVLGDRVQKDALRFLELTGRIDQQAAEWLRKLQAAELTETDDEMRAQFEEHAQTLRALSREVREAESEFRQAMQALRQFERVIERLEATAAGGA